ncbi:MAG: GNAT family N-acetyltransferase [Pseudomonadota bacterium]
MTPCTPLDIAVESPLSADAARLIAASDAVLLAHYPPEDCFSLDVGELDKPDIAFFVARCGPEAVGCVALVDCGHYGEIKRLFVDPMARGRGAARALMAALETHARAADLACVRLETGDRLEAAVALYKRLGYSIREAFGDYENIPASLFMEKHL